MNAMNRRDSCKCTAASALGSSGVAQLLTADAFGEETASMPLAPRHSEGPFWPDGARLAVSISMQFEAGAQLERGAESPFPPLDPKYPDLPAQKWYAYGVNE